MIVQIISWLFAVVCLIGVINRKWSFHAIALCFLMRAIGHTLSISFVVLNLGGIIIYHKDFLVICIILRMILKFRQYVHMPKRLAPVYISVFLMIGSMAIGLLQNGFGYLYVGDIRKFVGFFIPILYLSMESHHYDIEYVRKWIDKYMAVLLLFCLVCWTQTLLTGKSIASNLGLGTEGGGLRVLGSTYSMVLAIYTLFLLYGDWFARDAKQKFSFLTAVYAIVVIILQHNSVWVAFLCGMAAMLIQGFAKEGVRNKRLLVNVFLLAIVGTAAFSLFLTTRMGILLENTFSKFYQISEGTGTMGDRFLIWRQNLAKLDRLSWILGQGFGYNKAVVLHGATTEMSIHNAYVEAILCGGVVSLLVIIGIMWSILKNSWKREIAISSITISILIYWFAYMYEFEIAIVIGFFVNYLSFQKNRIKTDRME